MVCRRGRGGPVNGGSGTAGWQAGWGCTSAGRGSAAAGCWAVQGLHRLLCAYLPAPLMPLAPFPVQSDLLCLCLPLPPRFSPCFAPCFAPPPKAHHKLCLCLPPALPSLRAGTNYKLTLRVEAAGAIKFFEAKIWGELPSLRAQLPPCLHPASVSCLPCCCLDPIWSQPAVASPHTSPAYLACPWDVPLPACREAAGVWGRHGADESGGGGRPGAVNDMTGRQPLRGS